jgi:hypothetical protein
MFLTILESVWRDALGNAAAVAYSSTAADRGSTENEPADSPADPVSPAGGALESFIARVIQTVTAARDIAQRDAAAARAAGNEAEAEKLEAAAREAEHRLTRLRGIRDKSQASDSGWWL